MAPSGPICKRHNRRPHRVCRYGGVTRSRQWLVVYWRCGQNSSGAGFDHYTLKGHSLSRRRGEGIKNTVSSPFQLIRRCRAYSKNMAASSTEKSEFDNRNPARNAYTNATLVIRLWPKYLMRYCPDTTPGLISVPIPRWTDLLIPRTVSV